MFMEFEDFDRQREGGADESNSNIQHLVHMNYQNVDFIYFFFL